MYKLNAWVKDVFGVGLIRFVFFMFTIFIFAFIIFSLYWAFVYSIYDSLSKL